MTVVATAGSTPGKVGYKMLVWAGGRETVGTVGGGLVEAKMIQAAADMFAEPVTRLFQFELGRTADDEDGICGGSVELLVESFDKGSLPMLRGLCDTASSGRSGVLVSVISPEKPPGKMFLADEAAIDANTNAQFPAEILEAVRQGTGGKKVCAGGTDVFVETIEARPMLFLMGAGHLAGHICKYAKSLQFRVTVCDDRNEYADKDRFPDADDIVVENFESAFDKLHIDGDSYVVIVTRGHKCDETVLERALRTNARYIGMIGSKRKTRTIFQKLARKGVPEELLNKVYSPIGISIGALTPEEIALSIVCELVKIRRLGPEAGVGHMKEPARRDEARQSL